MTLEQFRAILSSPDSYNRDYLVSLCKGADIALGKVSNASRWIPVLERIPTYEESTEIEGDKRVKRLIEVTIELSTSERYVGYAYFEDGRWVRQDMILDLEVSQVVAWRIPEPYLGDFEL